MSGYTPVFDSVYHGTLCGKWPTLPVWLTLLPMADKDGCIDLTYQAITALTGWPIDLLRNAISELMQPDPDSRSDEHEGRRLVLLEPEVRQWGWRVVNHARYREKARLKAKSEREISTGLNARRMGDRRGPPETAEDRRAPPVTPSQTQTQTQTKEEEGEKRAKRAPNAQRLPADFALTQERRARAEGERVDPEREFAKFADYWRSASGASARKHDWDAAWRNWCRKAGEFKPRQTSQAAERTWRPTKEDAC